MSKKTREDRLMWFGHVIGRAKSSKSGVMQINLEIRQKTGILKKILLVYVLRW